MKSKTKNLIGVPLEDETVFNEYVSILKDVINKFMIEDEYDWEGLSTGRSFFSCGGPTTIMEVDLIERLVSEHSEFIRFDIRGHNLETNRDQYQFVTSWIKDGDSIRLLGCQISENHSLRDEEIEHLVTLRDEEIEHLTEIKHDQIHEFFDEINQRLFRNN